jgi:hypothetical protein
MRASNLLLELFLFEDASQAPNLPGLVPACVLPGRKRACGTAGHTTLPGSRSRERGADLLARAFHALKLRRVPRLTHVYARSATASGGICRVSGETSR